MNPRIGIGLGVVDIKVNHVETPEEIAGAIERAEKALGPGRVRYVHPDCGFWMLKRSVADRKIAALVKGRDLVSGPLQRRTRLNQCLTDSRSPRSSSSCCTRARGSRFATASRA